MPFAGSFCLCFVVEGMCVGLSDGVCRMEEVRDDVSLAVEGWTLSVNVRFCSESSINQTLK